MVKTRIKYIDTLKALAILGIIIIHASYIGEKSYILNISLGNIQHLVRWAVPIFFMVSGALLLNKDVELDVFLKKRLSRIICPWAFFTCFIFIAGINLENETVFITYWYALLIIGTYLAIPIINKFIQNASSKEINYYVVLIILASLLNQTFRMLNLRYSLDIIFFLCPISYLILGYYLYNKEFELKSSYIILISILVFVSATLVKLLWIGNFYMDYTYTVRSYVDLGIFQILQAASVFLIIKHIYCNKNRGVLLKIRNFLETDYVNRFIASVSRSSYGMYLTQNLFINKTLLPLMATWSLTRTEACLSILIVSVSVFFISWIITLIFGKIPYLKIFSGYH